MKNLLLKSFFGVFAGVLIFCQSTNGQTNSATYIECFEANKPRDNKLELIWKGVKMSANSEQAIVAAQNCKSKRACLDKPYYQLNLQESKKATALIIVIHGGAYKSSGIFCEEGTITAKQFYKEGYTTISMNYRVPDNPAGALQDIQRMIRIARENAEEWNIDPNKIAVIGFSAGANLAARVSAPAEKESYEKLDKIDNNSAMPNATILIYPAYCDNAGNVKRWQNKIIQANDYNQKYKLADNLKITKETPPAFIYEAMDDPYINAGFAYYLALKDVNVKSALHIPPQGGHGGGMKFRKKDDPLRMQLCLEWLESLNFPKAKK